MGERIKQLRSSNGFTQEMLAKIIRIEKSEVVVKEVYNGVLDFYVDYGFASSIYDDWFWKIFYEKGSQGNKFNIWISDFDVYEEQRHMGICS